MKVTDCPGCPRTIGVVQEPANYSPNAPHKKRHQRVAPHQHPATRTRCHSSGQLLPDDAVRTGRPDRLPDRA